MLTVVRYIFSLSHSDVNLLGNDGQTPLHLAAMSSKIEEELKSLKDSKSPVCLYALYSNYSQILSD